MRVIFTVLITAFVFVYSTQASATLPREWPHESSDLKPDPKVAYGVLANGLRYAVMENNTPASQASIRLLFDVGSKHEYDDERGIAHFIEHMAFNGSKNVPEGELVKMLERHGLAFGADANAYTSYEQTVYQLDLPNVRTQTLDAAFMLMRETASNISFDEAAIERERGVVLAEKRRTNVHALRSADARLSFTYPGTRMLDRRPIGTEEGISTITRDQMITFYNQFYRPEKAFFVIVGDFEKEAILRRIETTFADWAAVGNPRDLAYASDPAQIEAPSLEADHFQNEEDRASISVLFSKPYEKEADTSQNRLDGLFEFAGNSILSTRLQNLRMDGKAAYLGAGVNQSTFNNIAKTAYLGLYLDESHWQQSLADAVLELNKAIQHGFSDAELKELSANLRTNFEYQVSIKDKQQSGALANGIMSAFFNNTVFTPPETGLEIFDQFQETISAERIWDEFKDQWTGTPARLFFISQSPIKNAEADLINTFSSAIGAEVEAPENRTEQAFAYTDFGAPGEIVSRREIEGLDALAIKFENNVMLNLKKTNLQEDTVHLTLRFGGGVLAAPKEEPGLLTLLSGTFTGGGVEAHSATDLRQLLAGSTASANLSAGQDSFVFRGAVTPKDLLQQLQLWAAYMTAPAYRSEPIDHYKQSVESLYHSLDNSPGQVARYQIGEFIYGGDPRFYLPPKDSIERLSADELSAFMTTQLQGSAIEITIVGDLDIDTATAAVAKTFGALPAREAKPRPYTEGRQVSFPVPGTTILTHRGSDDQAILQLYWHTTDYSDVAQSAKLDLLRNILNNRIREAVRETLGASYAPSFSNLESEVFPGFGYFALSVDAKPDEIATITAVVHQQISEVTGGAISADDIERARKPMLENLTNAKKHNNHWLGRLSRAQSKPKSLSYLPAMQDALTSATSTELQALAAEYLQKEQTYTIQIVPETHVEAPTVK